jgi:transcriptional regulator with XRE-family HTH domain
MPPLPHPQDIALGARIRALRRQKDPPITQEWLALAVGCTVQQIQKYESGENRVSFSRLTEIAKALDMSVVAVLDPWNG